MLGKSRDNLEAGLFRSSSVFGDGSTQIIRQQVSYVVSSFRNRNFRKTNARFHHDR